ncbi:MAG: aspartate carbamoyltransferase catalytic subunit [Acidobacteriota bacterium]
MTGLSDRHLLGTESLTPEEISLVLDTADSMLEIGQREIKKVPTLRGRTVVNLFCEPSTRTRSSFEIAAKRLSADTLNFSASQSSLVKGETLLDTARTLEAMEPDIVVIRHAAAGAARFLADRCLFGVINAGDGMHEHPTQALLDAYTIRQHKKGFNGLRVAIVGDCTHSRVVRSNIWLLSTMGAGVVLAGPPTMMPPGIETLGSGVEVTSRIDEALDGADVVMMLRIQRERQSRLSMPSLREYAMLYCLTRERLEKARPDAIVMHPGPINRGVEIADDVADGEGSVILQQVANGVAIRMAVLYLLAGASGGQAKS